MSEEKESKLKPIINPFLHNLDAMEESMDILMGMTWALAKAAREEHLKILEKYGTVIEEDEDSKKYEIPNKNSRETLQKKRKQTRAKRAQILLPRLFLISFVSEYDAFLGNLIVAVFNRRPELLKSADKVLSFAELMEFESLEEAKNSLLEIEVENILRKSHSDQFTWMENRFSIKLREKLDVWPTFIELTERRNLFVHTDGVVTSQYLKVCSNHKVEIGNIKQ